MMTQQQVVDECMATLCVIGKGHWGCDLVESFDPDKPTTSGLCQHTQRMILISAKILDDPEECRETIIEECAHALCPGDDGVGNHGLPFQAARDYVREVNAKLTAESIAELIDERQRKALEEE
jgi:hypothetical protein